MIKKWNKVDKIIVFSGLFLAVILISAGTLLYLGITNNFIRLN